MVPVTRFAAFKYKSGTTDAQKRQALDGLIKLYNDNAYMVNHGPLSKCLTARLCILNLSLIYFSASPGGRNNNSEGFDKGFDVVFTIEFKVFSLSSPVFLLLTPPVLFDLHSPKSIAMNLFLMKNTSNTKFVRLSHLDDPSYLPSPPADVYHGYR